MRIERRYTKEGQSAYADIKFRLTTSEIKNPDGSVVFKLDNVEVPRILVAGRLRRAGAEVFPQSRRPGRAEEGRGELGPLLPVALGPRRRRRSTSLPEKERIVGETLVETGVRSAGRHLDLLGLEGRLFRHRRRRPGLLRRASLHAGRRRCARRTRRNGSTPACTGPTASMGRARATITSIPSPASSRSRHRPTSTRSRTPASSSRSPTTSSTRAASWTCGCAKRACSNTAPAPAPTSRRCAARTRSSPAAASRPA